MAKDGWRAVSERSHNVEAKLEDGHLLIRVKTDAKTVPSKNGHPILGTSRGFADFEGYPISFNVMQRKEASVAK